MMEATARRIELVTAGGQADRVSLRGVHVRARLSGMGQRTTIEQTFVNIEPRAIEAAYTFPLPEGAAVCGFEVVTGDRVLTGVVDEAEAAAEKYENAISEGHAAYALDQDRPDVFTVRVGNLNPGQAATIRITYVCALERVDKAIRVAFPTTVAPRYITGSGMDRVTAAVDGEALNPPHVLSVPYGLSMEVEIDLGRELDGVSSPSHAVSVAAMGDGVTRVSFAGGVTEMDRDVVLVLAMKKEAEPRVQVAPGPDAANYLAVTFVPEFDVDELAEPAPSETVFVLDCSGSMQGQSIAQATTALELCLRSLSAGDRFNICRFGSKWEMMSSEPVAYSEESLARAIQYVRRGADLGGTELYAPLQAVLGPSPSVGTVRQVILLTDGQVSNEPAVIQLARSRRTHNRVFAFGIGSACSAHLVRGIARATGGAAEFITAGERIEEKVLRTFGRMASPQLTELALEWDGCDVQTLAEMPPVFDGDVFAVYGRAAGPLPKQVTLSATTALGRKEWRVNVPSSCEDGRTIATLWARRTIQSLEEVNGVGIARARTGSRPPEAERMIRISKDFGLLSSLTSFVAVEHRSEAERNEGRPAVRRVPVKLAAGWGGVAAAGGISAGLAGIAIAPGAASALPRSFIKMLSKSQRVCREEVAPPAQAAPAPEALLDLSRERGDSEVNPFASGFRRRRGLDGSRGTTEKREGKPYDDLILVLAQQSADGSFARGAVIDRLLDEEPNLKQIIDSHMPQAVEPADRASVVMTLTVLLLLATRFADREPVWRRAYRKAIRVYLTGATGKTAAEVEEWLTRLKAAGAALG